LSEACGLAERFELRAKRPATRQGHGSPILLLPAADVARSLCNSSTRTSMSFSSASMEAVRPAAYARAHRSAPRRDPRARSACSRRSCTEGSTIVIPVLSMTASRAPRTRAAHAWSPLSSAAAASGTRCRRTRTRHEFPNGCETFTHQPDRLIGVPAPHRHGRRAYTTQRHEPRTGALKHRCGLVEQAFCFAGIAGRQCHRPPDRSANSQCPTGIASMRNPSRCG
jgi:hypothetical protein